MKAKAYYCAYYRGPEGDEASVQTIAHNILIAEQTAHTINNDFAGMIDLWVPHNQRMINMAWLKGWVDSENVLELCCDIIEADLPILLVHNRENHISPGMRDEIDTALACDCLVVQFEDWDEDARRDTAIVIQEWMARYATSSNT